MPRDVFVLKIQRELCHPESAPEKFRDFREMGPWSLFLRKSRELFGPEKPVVKLQPAFFEKLIFWHVFDVRRTKMTGNLVFIDSEVLPVTRQSTRSTRSSSINSITYIPKRSRTVTYQRSFFIRACRKWNVLPAEVRTSRTSIASFKHSLLQCYFKTSEPGEQSVLGAI